MDYRPIIKKFSDDAPVYQELLPSEGYVILRTSNWLGDAVMSLPATWQLRCILPLDVKLAVLTPAGLAPVWQSATWIDNVIPMPEKRIDAATASAVKELAPELGIALPNSFGSAWDLYRCNCKKLYGRSGNLRSWMFNRTAPQWQSVKRHGYADRHQVSYYLDLIAKLGDIKWNTEFPPLKVDDKNSIKIGNNSLILAPGAAFGPAKQWPLRNFVEIGKRWLKEGGGVAIVGTRKEIGDEDFSKFGFQDLVGKTDLAQLMQALNQAKCVLSNDSGAMHLSAALGIPGTAVFGSTDPWATGPIAAIDTKTHQPANWKYILPNNLLCTPCFERFCQLNDKKLQYSCLNAITTEIVWDELCSLH